MEGVFLLSAILTCLNYHDSEIYSSGFPSPPPFLSYKHSDENHLTCSGPPMEIPGEDTDKMNVTYTYSVRFEVSVPCHHLTFVPNQIYKYYMFINSKALISIKFFYNTAKSPGKQVSSLY